MNEEETTDVNAEETGEEPSTSKETTSETSDESTEESGIETHKNEEDIDELLADGTLADKEIRVKKTKYDEQSEKAKLYDSFAPLLSRLNQNPEVLDKLLGDKEDPIETRLKRLEEAQRGSKEKETREVLGQALKTWSDFKDRFSDMRPIISSLEKQGISYAEAVQRAYFAVNPEAVKEEARLASVTQATVMENQTGKVQSSGGVHKVVREPEEDIELSEADREFAQKANIPLELYKKHAAHIDKFKDL